MEQICWNVFISNINRSKIETFNVFEHYYFAEDCAKLLKDKEITKEKFGDKMRNEILYYFGYKCEWEIFIQDMFDRDGSSVTKVDVMKQLLLNYDQFVDYVWENRARLIKLVKARKRKEKQRG